jgi:rSAM/selenodomain-associated transferase 2
MPLSVIIPMLNEATTIAATIQAVRRQGPREIIVVDGGSSDDTVLQAADADLVVASDRGRARQMNTGAAVAQGDLLLFLHADCHLEEGALSAAVECLRRRRVVAGCFRMQVQAAAAIYRLIGFCATARVRLTGIVYGDQGLFVRREDFMGVGGFPEVRLMEDVLISRRLRRRGRIVVAEAEVLVSPRRWQRQGLVRQTLRNWALTALATAGVSPDSLARFYPAVR